MKTTIYFGSQGAHIEDSLLSRELSRIVSRPINLNACQTDIYARIRAKIQDRINALKSQKA